MKEQARSEHPGRSWVAIVVIVALLLGIPALLLLAGGLEITTSAGSREFFSGAVGVLSASLIAFVFQFRAFMIGLYRLFGYSLRWLLLPTLIGFFLAIGVGVASALSALQDCEPAACGESRDMNNVVLSLLYAGVVLAVAMSVAVVEASRAYREEIESRLTQQASWADDLRRTRDWLRAHPRMRIALLVVLAAAIGALVARSVEVFS